MTEQTNAKKPIYKKWWFWVGIVVVIGLIGQAGKKDGSTTSSTSGNEPPAITAAAPPAEKSSVLEVQSWQWSMDDIGFVHVKGEVKNISSEPLKNVQAVARIYDKDKNFITSESALLEYNPIMPGQTSPFEVVGKANPMMESAQLEFSELMGGTLSHSSKAKK